MATEGEARSAAALVGPVILGRVPASFHFHHWHRSAAAAEPSKRGMVIWDYGSANSVRADLELPQCGMSLSETLASRQTKPQNGLVAQHIQN
jgi:hypothetical protein